MRACDLEASGWCFKFRGAELDRDLEHDVKTRAMSGFEFSVCQDRFLTVDTEQTCGLA